jgi:LysM repeat protein
VNKYTIRLEEGEDLEIKCSLDKIGATSEELQKIANIGLQITREGQAVKSDGNRITVVSITGVDAEVNVTISNATASDTDEFVCQAQPGTDQGVNINDQWIEVAVLGKDSVPTVTTEKTNNLSLEAGKSY